MKRKIHPEEEQDITVLNTAFYGDIEDLKILIDQGEDVDQRDETGATALIHAAIHNHPEILELLLDAGANICYIDEYECTALDYAKEHKHSEIIELLQDAAESRLTEAATENAPESLSELLEYIDIEEYHDTLLFALMHSAEYGYFEIAELLLEQGAVNVNEPDGNFTAPLMVAAENGCADILELFLKAGADTRDLNEFSKTALDIALESNDEFDNSVCINLLQEAMGLEAMGAAASIGEEY